VKRAVGYIRVSSIDQERKVASPATQKADIRNEAKAKRFKLTKIYHDKGISGRSMKGRFQLQELLDAAEKKKFEAVFIWTMSRFGRNVADLARNMNRLNDLGVSIHTIKEGIDTSNPYGRMVFQVLGAVSELESVMIAERTLAGRKYWGDRQVPVEGIKPFARKWVFDPETQKRQEGHWELEEEKTEAIQNVAKRYLAGESLKEMALELTEQFPEERSGVTYPNLLNVLKYSCGDVWKTKFGTYEVPRLLDDLTIQKVKQKLKENYRAPRNYKADYALKGGFLRCGHCDKVLIGQTQEKQKKMGKRTYQYYRHPQGGVREPCKHYASISTKLIEDAVFATIFANMTDDQAFKDAVSKALPDSKDVKKLKDKIQKAEKGIKTKQKELDRLAASVAKGNLQAATAKKTEDRLYREIGELSAQLERDRRQINSIPDPETFEKKAKKIRMGLMDFYGGQLPAYDPDDPEVHGKTWYELMTIKDKVRLVNQIFPKGEVDEETGKPYGVYLEKNKDGTWNFFINALFFAGWTDGISLVGVGQDIRDPRQV
jgi:site-specific DNA recombinase